MSDYTIAHNAERNETSIRSYTAINFSSNGALYALMVVIEKAQAYLSSIRSWVLISNTVQILWKLIVRVMEKRAYQFARGTFITNPEIITIGAIAAVQLQDEIFLMCEKKWAIEDQRVNDVTSFAGGYIAHGNTFQKGNDYRSTTPLEVLQILYGPLVHIILLSVGMISVWLIAKFVFFYGLAHIGGKGKRSNAIVVDTTNLSEASSSSEGEHHHPRMKEEATTSGEEYARLPLEEVLDIPIRANSLVRYGLSMEIVRDGKQYIRPSCYLDYGIMLKHGERRQHSISVADIFKHKSTKSYNSDEFASTAESIASSRSVVRSRKFFGEISTNSLLEAAVPLSQDTLVRRAGSASPAQAANDVISPIIRESDNVVDVKDN